MREGRRGSVNGTPASKIQRRYRPLRLVRFQTASLSDLLARLRADLHAILRAGVDSVDPVHLVHSALSRGALGSSTNQPVTIVAAGKAAWLMAVALEDRVTVAAGIVAGPRARNSPVPQRLEWFEASHPSPNAASEAAGRRALALAADSRSRGGVLVLLSGGASSMLAAPAAGLSLGDKMLAARTLMNAGVAIAELNCVRKHLSAIKGGRLAAVAGRALTLAISDVHGPIADDPAVIGSGPTVPDPTTYADALDIVRRAGVIESLPGAVIAHLERGADESPKPGDPRLAESQYEVIGNRQMAMEGAARAARDRGYEVHVVGAATSGEARESGAAFAERALGAGAGHPLCVIQSGETTVRVRGTGRGGRNQEFALGALPVLDGLAEKARAAVLASAGTDGVDGHTDAAGAMVDTTTSARATRHGLRPEAAFSSNGAYDFFAPLGDLIMWGPTGTNVGDLHAVLIHP